MKLKISFFAAAVILATAAILESCASNPLSHAQTIGQKAYASYGSFVIYEEQAAVVVQDVNVPENVKSALRLADAKAKPVADKLLDAVLAVDKVRVDLAAGVTTNDKLVIATANLQKWYAEADPAIRALVSAVQGAR